MRRRRTSRSRLWLPLLPLAAALGCAEAPPQPAPEPSAAPAPASVFDPSSAGTIRGRVTWEGPPPVVPPFEVRSYVPDGGQGQPRLIREHPNAPVIDP